MVCTERASITTPPPPLYGGLGALLYHWIYCLFTLALIANPLAAWREVNSLLGLEGSSQGRTTEGSIDKDRRGYIATLVLGERRSSRDDLRTANQQQMGNTCSTWSFRRCDSHCRRVMEVPNCLRPFLGTLMFSKCNKLLWWCGLLLGSDLSIPTRGCSSQR